MSEERACARWRLLGRSVRGASHVRTGLKNQDALAHWISEENGGSAAILAVSDGHGSDPHFRSDIGAQCAVDSAIVVLQRYLDEHGSTSSLADVQQSLNRTLPGQLVNAWTEAVTVHRDRYPLTEHEQALDGAPLTAYGATLLAAAIGESFIALLQLGDGDILCVSDQGETTRPIADDPRLIANQTTSLCQPDAVDQFRVSLLDLRLGCPALMVLSSDGYANSFRSDDDFLLIGSDYLKLLRTNGVDAVETELTEMLEDASAQGSGDDITVGLIQRTTEPQEGFMAPRQGPEDIEKRVAVLERDREAIRSAHPNSAGLARRLRRLEIAVIMTTLLSLLSLGLVLLERAPRNETPPVSADAPPPAPQDVGPAEPDRSTPKTTTGR